MRRCCDFRRAEDGRARYFGQTRLLRILPGLSSSTRLGATRRPDPGDAVETTGLRAGRRRYMKKHLALAFCVLAASLASAAAPTAAAESWPARPVKVVVGFAPGGPTDLFARLIAQQLTEQTGKNFFIENVSGAGGNVGAVRVAQSPADGYTLLVTGGNLTNNPY